MHKISNKLYVLLHTIILVSFLVAISQYVGYLSKETSVVRVSTHLHSSIIIAAGLTTCNIYPYNIFKDSKKPYNNLNNSDHFSDLGSVDCLSASPTTAVDMGHSLNLALAAYFGKPNIGEIAFNLIIYKYVLLTIIATIGMMAGYRLITLTTVTTLSIFIPVSQMEFMEYQMLMVNHNFNWLHYVFATFFFSLYMLNGRLGIMKVISGFLLATFFFYIYLYRSSDFYLLVSTLAFCIPIITYTNKNKLDCFSKTVIIVMSVISIHTAYNLYLDTTYESKTPITKHAVMHPIILGLGQPETPFSQKYNYKWGSDFEVLKVAQSLNPDLNELYTDRYSAALKEVYLREWLENPTLMIESYFIKAKHLFSGNGWWIYLVILSSYLYAWSFKSMEILVLNTALAAKVAESIIIYSGPFHLMFHQSIRVLVTIVVATILIGIFGRMLRMKFRTDLI